MSAITHDVVQAPALPARQGFLHAVGCKGEEDVVLT